MKYLEIILMIAVVVLVILVGYITIVKYYKDFDDFCNNKYGEGNWYLNETTGDLSKCRGLGQCWECIREDWKMETYDKCCNGIVCTDTYYDRENDICVLTLCQNNPAHLISKADCTYEPN